MHRFLILLMVVLGPRALSLGQCNPAMRGFKALEEHNYGIAANQFKTLKNGEKSIAYFGLACLFSHSREFYNVDSALFYLKKSMDSWSICEENLSNKKRKLYQTLGWTKEGLEGLLESLYSHKFADLKDTKDLAEIQIFLKENKDFSGFSEVQRFSDSLRFNQCSNHSLFCILTLKKDSPDSYLKKDIEELIEDKTFSEWVVEGNENELATFILYHPSSPYYSIASDELYRLFEEKKDTNEFKRFILEYPINRNINRAWRAFFRLSSGNYDVAKMQQFVDRFPQFPFKQNVLDELGSFEKKRYPFLANNGLSGYMDELGNVVISPQYDHCSDFNEGLAVVSKNGGLGVIDKLGNERIPFKYESLYDFHNGYAVAELNGKFGVINRMGVVLVDFIYDELDLVFDDYLYYQRGEEKGIRSIPSEQLILLGIQDFNVINESMAIVSNENFEGVMNRSFEVVIPIKFDQVAFMKDFFIVTSHQKKGLVDLMGQEIIPVIYDEIGKLNEGFRAVRSGSKFTHIEMKSGRVLNPWYDLHNNNLDLARMQQGRFIITKNSKLYWMDTLGKSSKPLPLMNLIYAGKVLIGQKKLNQKYIIVDNLGTLLSPLEYESVNLIQPGLFVLQRNGKFGVYSLTQEWILPCMYDYISCFAQDSYLYVELDSKKGIFNMQGNSILPVEFDLIEADDSEWSLRKGMEMLYFLPDKMKFIKAKQ